ncbi:MAG: cation:proton antiporter, partial [Dehalococcoidia bacterium]|nr:cation:proton antiporter [Dehalococcoidia bacterium]
IIGFLTDFLFRKTGFPDILILMAVGYLIGPVFHIIDPASISPAAQFIAGLALVIITFNGGIAFDISKVVSSTPRALILVIVGVAISIAVIAIPALVIFQWRVLDSILLGTVVGGTSSAIVIGLLNRARVSSRISSLLSLESVLNSPIVIVIALMALQAISAGETGVEFGDIGLAIGISVGIGLGIGLAAGIFWLWMLKLMRREEYNDIMNLAVVFLLYFFVEHLDGSGVIAVLAFALILGNGLRIRKFRLEQTAQATQMMRRFTSEIYFLVKTFFFIYLGMIIAFDQELPVALGTAAGLALLFARYLAVVLTSIGSRELWSYKELLTAMMARGEAAAVLVQLIIAAGIQNSNLYANFVMAVILTTVIISAAGMLIFGREQEEAGPPPKADMPHRSP